MKKQSGDIKFIFLPLSGGDGTAPKEIQILPSGMVQSKKGAFLFDDQAKAELLRTFNSQQNDMVVDYEHQSLTGQEAPAAGWIKNLIDKGPDGLWAMVEWTPRAEGRIKDQEYKYLSPVVLIRKSDRRAIRLHSAALTNTPAIDGMHAIANSMGIDSPESEEQEMEELLKRLAAALGLADGASEADVMTAVAALKAPMVANKEVMTLLDLKENATLDEAKGAILALKNPSGYVKVEEFKALKDQLDKRDRDELVTLALTTGKVAPTQKAWAEEYALKDPTGFKAFLDVAPQVVPMGKLPVGDPPAKDPLADETQLSVNSLLGITATEFKDYQAKNK
jgi:phage I-like protein